MRKSTTVSGPRIAARKLFVEHRQETEARAGIGDDAGIVARLVQHLRLDQQLPGERVDGGFRPADPPADPLIDQSLGLGVGAAKTSLWPLGREVFQDSWRFPEHETVLFESGHAAVWVLGEIVAGARFADARVDRHLVEGNAKLGCKQADFPCVRGRLKFIEGNGHGVSVLAFALIF